MLRRFSWVLGLCALCGAMAGSAHGQYMFLDTNSDGIRDHRDRLTTATTAIHVYIDTNHRRDGSPASCSMSSSALTINSYEIIVRLVSGSITYGTWTDGMGMNFSFGNAQGGGDRYMGLGSGTILPPGRYRLGTLAVSGVTPATALAIVPTTPLGSVYATSFGSACEGNDFDNTMKLGSDWFDTDGLSFGCEATDPNNTGPTIAAPAAASGTEGAPVEIQASVSDPDQGNTLLVTVSGAPVSLSLSGNAGPAPLSPVLGGTLGYGDAGVHAVVWEAGDGQCAFDSATTVLTVGAADRPPTLTAPPTANGQEGAPLVVGAYAYDPDGEPITRMEVAGLPLGAIFEVSGSNTSGTVRWTPGYTQSGIYALDFTAGNALLSTARTILTIANTDRGPIVTAPATLTGAEGVPLSFVVTAIDPDADAITTLEATPLPAGALFTPSADNLSGEFAWTPGFDQGGNYTISFAARNTLNGSATTRITVVHSNRPPVLTLPGDQQTNEGVRLAFTVQVTDPDGESINSFSAGNRPPGSSFYIPSYPYAIGEFSWTPTFTQSGHYTVTFTASNTLSTSGTVGITVHEVNQLPLIAAPNTIYSPEGAPIAFDVAAPDPDGEAVTIAVLNRPVGATFYDLGNSYGTFQWTPGYGQAGTYVLTFTARDSRGDYGTPKSTTIAVDDFNRYPVASAGGPYSGVIGVPIAFDGTESMDPDGNALQYAWDFGDGIAGVGATPSHAYSTGGRFSVTLSVSDGYQSAADVTSAAVQDVFPARAFTTNANATIRLGSGKATWCAQIEPEGDSYLNTAVIASSLSLAYGTGKIFAESGKTSIGSDKDANGIQELTACFTKPDLRTLFADLPKGTSTVTVLVEGDLASGGTLRGNLTIDVVGTGATLAASLSPNPIHPTGTLTFRTTVSGRLRVSLFDLQGRLVRRYLDDAAASAGYQDVRIDGLGEDGMRLPSGVYFYRIEAVEGTAVGRVIVAR